MLDNLALTTYIPADPDCLKRFGDFVEDRKRTFTYKYCFNNGSMRIFIEPHKYSVSTNSRIPFTKIDISPKHFSCFDEAFVAVLSLFPDEYMTLEDFNVSRYDLAADIVGVSIDSLYAKLIIRNLRKYALRIIETSVYAGKNPLYRIYDKKNELKTRKRKGMVLIEREEKILTMKEPVTRFEIQIRPDRLSLKTFIESVEVEQTRFDKMIFLNISNNADSGLLHHLWHHINRKFRKELLECQDINSLELIKQVYLVGVREWFQPKESF